MQAHRENWVATILIVEDDQRTAKYIQQNLADAGHTCIIESAGENATETAKAHGCDLLDPRYHASGDLRF